MSEGTTVCSFCEQSFDAKDKIIVAGKQGAICEDCCIVAEQAVRDSRAYRKVKAREALVAEIEAKNPSEELTKLQAEVADLRARLDLAKEALGA